MTWRTQFDSRPPIYSEAGDPIVKEYTAVFDSSGHWTLQETGEFNLYDRIQADRDLCDINLILRRFAAGDSTALSVAQGAFFDASEMPKSYAEFFSTMAIAESTFLRLPVDVRSKFGHSWRQWLSELGSPDFLVKMGRESASVHTDSVEEVVSDES